MIGSFSSSSSSGKPLIGVLRARCSTPTRAASAYFRCLHSQYYVRIPDSVDSITRTAKERKFNASLLCIFERDTVISQHNFIAALEYREIEESLDFFYEFQATMFVSEKHLTSSPTKLLNLIFSQLFLNPPLYLVLTFI